MQNICTIIAEEVVWSIFQWNFFSYSIASTGVEISVLNQNCTSFVLMNKIFKGVFSCVEIYSNTLQNKTLAGMVPHFRIHPNMPPRGKLPSAPMQGKKKCCGWKVAFFDLPGSSSWISIFFFLIIPPTVRPEIPIPFVSIHCIILNCAAATMPLIEIGWMQSTSFNSQVIFQ